MKKKAKQKPFLELIIVHAAVLFVVIAGIVSLIIYSKNQNSQDKSVTFDWSIDSVDREDLYVRVTPQNGWDSDGMFSNEYDAELVNNSGHSITDWTVVFIVDQGYRIVNSWNGQWTNATDKIFYIPGDYNERVKNGEKKYFGTIISSDSPIEFNEMTLNYRTEIRLEDYSLFWVLLITGVLCLFSMGAITFANIRVRNFENQHSAYKTLVHESLRTIANIIDTKDEYTKGHSLRVAIYSRQIAKRMGLSDYEQERIYYIGLLHDIGKIGIPSSILTKPSRLTDEEFEVIKRHPMLGCNIMKDFTSIKGAENGIRYHHERYDGKGYNDGLKGEEIPLEGRIICVADSYDAMSSRRCYRNALQYDFILEELKKNAGIQFDPDIVKHMIDMIEGGYAPISDAEMRDYRI